MARRLYWPSDTLKPAKSIVASAGVGMHALSKNMSTNTPGRPRAEPTFVANATTRSDVAAEARDRARRVDAEDQGGHHRRPVRERRSDGRDRGARRAGARGCCAGCRLDAGRRSGGLVRHGRDVLVLPLQEPRRLRRRRHDRDGRRGGGRARAHAALPRLGRQGHLSGGGVQLAPRRAAGRAPARVAGRARRLVRRAPGRRPALRAGGPRRARGASAPGRWRRSRLASVRDPPPQRRPPGTGAGPGGHRRPRLLPHADPPPAGDAPVSRRRAAAGDRRGGGHAPRDSDEPGAQAHAGRLGGLRDPLGAGLTAQVCGMRVWIDLTNSPHVLVLRPIVERLRADGHEVDVTARDFAQTLELCERFGIEPTVIGRHRGVRVAAKALGLASRSVALARWARGRRFDLAIGHGSNDVSVAAALLRVPSSTAFDYEWATVQHNVNCRLARAVVVPDVIPPARLRRYGAGPRKLQRYPGLKEEYYLADFEPDEA